MKATLSKRSIQPQPQARSMRRPRERQTVAEVRPSKVGGRAPARSTAPSVLFPEETRFYGRCDWLAFVLATVVVLGVYLWTLAPDLTLEDSGEMAVAAQHLGVPHPPGYPVWTLYAWTFTKLLPFSNVAWRVAVSSAVAGALACGLIALMVTRGSRLLVDSSHEPTLTRLDPRWRNSLSVMSGVIAGALFGFSDFVWSQAVIVEVYTLSVLSLTGVLACLFRWMHGPQQRRYLYLAWFLFGICLNNHQSLIVATLAIEVCVGLADARLGRDLFLGNVICYGLGLFAMTWGWLGALASNGPLLACYHVIGLSSLAMMAWLTARTKALGKEFHSALACAAVFLVGVGFYLLLPLFSMSNPPMNWAYPRTVPGFVHAITRGQYEPVHPSTSLGDYLQQLVSLARGVLAEFNPVWLAFGLLPLLLLGLRRLGGGQRGWMLGGVAFYLALGPGLLALLNPGNDRGSQALVRVFFGASEVPVAMAIGFGLALALAWVLPPGTHSLPSSRPGIWGVLRAKGWLLTGTALAGLWGLGLLLWTVRATELPLARNAAVFSLGLTVALGLLAALAQRWSVARVGLLAACCLMPVHSVLSHWWANEQRGHLFGFWFGHDMFTPPFRGVNGQLTYARAERQRALAQPEGAWVYPEMSRDAVLFGGTDPGRFCPTYMIFSESVLDPAQRRDPEFDRRDVSIITQNALADAHYLEYIRAHYQRSAQQDPPFFSELLRRPTERGSEHTNVLARLALPLDRALANLGGAIEKRRREQGLYPAKELRLPSNADLQRCLAEYVRDWQERSRRGQLNPAEVVRVNGQQAQLGGAAAVMGVNALLTRQIFEQNPDREFYVEESFPLEWMYPHLTPFGTILKLERQPPRELGPEIVERDRRFWRDYSQRLIGDWVKPETNIAEICTFAEQVHLRRGLAAYRGDRKFLRDGQAQKAFSKLRSAIAGVYDWRFRNATGQLHQVTQRLAQPGLDEAEAQRLRAEHQRLTAEQARMFREAEFASKQAYALCPYSPEAFQRLVNLLLTVGRVGEALAIAETSQKLDPGNPFYTNAAAQLRRMSPEV